jgi:ATP-binding cassette subfamily G (WHITE) protein 2 (PDR)
MSFFGATSALNADASIERSGASENGPTAVERQRSHDQENSPLAQAENMEKSKAHHETTVLEDGEKSASDGGEKATEAEKEEARREDEVHVLARRLTEHSHYSEAENNPLEAGEESKLNPASPHFNAKAWAKSLMHLQLQDPENNPIRTSGVAFRGLNVHGFGAETDYQQTVSSIWLQAATAVRRLLGAKQRRVEILTDFEGIVRAGEMLVVLGPPGSGCTTFLKTISGETFGFTVDKDSYLNYQGMSR